MTDDTEYSINWSKEPRMSKTVKQFAYIVGGILALLALRYIAHATGLWPFAGL